MENDSTRLNNNSNIPNNIIIIPDHPEPSNSNTSIHNKKRPRNEFSATTATTTPTTTHDQPENNHNANADVYSSSPFPKFKGVVPQQNGNWGAQIYANHQRVWLGTFKTATLAAMAYDSAAIKLRTGDLHRNFPWTGLTLQEPQFQSHYSADAVLAMIKDGSYQSKFEHFVRARSMTRPNDTTNNIIINNSVLHTTTTTPHYVTKLLFQKELTPSDVGKLNRLVIPKKFAVKYFPYISEENFVIDSDDVELVFYDREMTPWRFRYCYWKSSQSYVFTRGWNRFVRDNKLKANDVVTFYSRDQSGAAQSICLIDVTHTPNANNNNHNNITNDNDILNTRRGLGLENNDIEAKGFRLFGVEIK